MQTTAPPIFDLEYATWLSAEQGEQLRSLLQASYVTPGFTTSEVAASAFEPEQVLGRGRLCLARSRNGGDIGGCVVFVEPQARGRRLAAPNEAELQLLAVNPAERGYGLGQRLVQAVLDAAQQAQLNAVILWTQPGMAAAQRLYARAGFVHVPERDFSAAGRPFLFFRRALP